eukprot:10463664-Karenia_brevis.AAC.1
MTGGADCERLHVDGGSPSSSVRNVFFTTTCISASPRLLPHAWVTTVSRQALSPKNMYSVSKMIVVKSNMNLPIK